MKFLISLCAAMCILSFSLKAQFSTNSTGYAIAHNNGSNNVLFKLDTLTNQWAVVGPTGTDNIKSIATDLINKTVYAVDGGTFGKIDPQNGMFNPIGNIGQANGDFGNTVLNNIEGLTFDAVNQIMYATHRVESGDYCNPIPNSNDFLFQIDISTGQFVSGAMLDSNGNSADYSVIEPMIANRDYSCFAYDINDIAYNMYTDNLYAIHNNDYDCAITIINSKDGSVESFIDELYAADIIGLGFDNLGNLFGTSGIYNDFNYFDLNNLSDEIISKIDSTDSKTNFEGLDFIGPYNDLALKLSLSPGTSMPVNAGDEVAVTITIYNQGVIKIAEIDISNYIPDGLTLNDPLWSLLPNTNIAHYNQNAQLLAGQEITIPIHFTVDNDFTGTEIINSAEITASYSTEIFDEDGNFLALPDIDSSPDDYNDEVIYNRDEDDHDIATLTLGNTNTSNHFPCYAVSEGEGINPNTLYEFDPSTQQINIIGAVGGAVDSIQAMATDPVNNIIYAYNKGKNLMGVIDLNSANPSMFNPINTSLTGLGAGTANGDYGPVMLNDIVGLTYDPVNEILYGVHRIFSGDVCNPVSTSGDLLFQIDVSTGKFIPNVMLDSSNNSVDYAVIEPGYDDDYYCTSTNKGGIIYDVNDIAYNPYTGRLYVLHNQGEAETITTSDIKDGTVDANIFNIVDNNISALGFSALGSLYGTYNSDNINNLVHFDLQALQAEVLFDYRDNIKDIGFDAFDCFTAYNDLALSFKAPASTIIFEEGSTVTFTANVYNQGDFANKDITISNYLPEGLTLADADWTIDANNTAKYTITEVLNPGSSIAVPITFLINRNLYGRIITASAEISQSYNVNTSNVKGEILEYIIADIDSNPDDSNNEVEEDNTIVDNNINGRGLTANEDEDDHDIARFRIADLVQNIPLSVNRIPAGCGSVGSVEIEITDNSYLAPYTYKLLTEYGNLVQIETTNNFIHQFTNVATGKYFIEAKDATGETYYLAVIVSEWSANNGNINCSDDCPGYLTTPFGTLYGTFQAEKVVDIYGYVDGSQDTEFRICE